VFESTPDETQTKTIDMPDHQKIVRFRAGCSRHSCNELGPLLRETTLSFIYRLRSGGEAVIPKRLAHCEPCPYCPKQEP
jgi:hypothetical protein